ncbi:MAG: hypothetical protein KDE35_10440 [Geminicoccaceae bacterium]|nr:hypothetical protein [Geminicoccaceae bacterium]
MPARKQIEPSTRGGCSTTSVVLGLLLSVSLLPAAAHAFPHFSSDAAASAPTAGLHQPAVFTTGSPSSMIVRDTAEQTPRLWLAAASNKEAQRRVDMYCSRYQQKKKEGNWKYAKINLDLCNKWKKIAGKSGSEKNYSKVSSSSKSQAQKRVELYCGRYEQKKKAGNWKYAKINLDLCNKWKRIAGNSGSGGSNSNKSYSKVSNSGNSEAQKRVDLYCGRYEEKKKAGNQKYAKINLDLCNKWKRIAGSSGSYSTESAKKNNNKNNGNQNSNNESYTPSYDPPSSSGGGSWISGVACSDADAFGNWRGSKVEAVIGWAKYTGNWNDLLNYFKNGSLNKFKRARSEGRLASIGVPLFPQNGGNNFGACRNGQYDGYFREIASQLKNQGLGDIVIRLGWEANGDWYAWSGVKDPSGYKSCFQKVARTLRSVAPGLKIDWHNAKDTRNGKTAADLYPGGDVVDYVGVSYYDNVLPSRTQAAWNRSEYNGSTSDPHGIENWLSFAKSRGKKLAVAEWGTRDENKHGSNGDNPVFIENMYKFFKDNSGSIAYEAYFNCTHGNPDIHVIYPEHHNPRAAEAYRRLF